MEYWDMLLETGRLSTSGYAIKENVPRGWRRGVELTASWLPTDLFRVDANASFSVNRLKNFTAHVDRFDHDWISDANPGWNKMEQARETYSKTTMLLSPSIVSMLRCSCTPFKRVARGSLKTTTLSLDGKYVGKQYWDNTANADRCVPAYFVSNLSVCHEFDLGSGKLGLAGYVNNLFNRTYYASAWVYRAVFAVGGAYQEEGLYPQPPINFLFKLSYRF
jgi:iron complex outermembrane receptor protein